MFRWRHVKDDTDSVIEFTQSVFAFVGEALAAGKNVRKVTAVRDCSLCSCVLAIGCCSSFHDMFVPQVLIHCLAGAHRAGTTGEEGDRE